MTMTRVLLRAARLIAVVLLVQLVAAEIYEYDEEEVSLSLLVACAVQGRTWGRHGSCATVGCARGPDLSTAALTHPPAA